MPKAFSEQERIIISARLLEQGKLLLNRHGIKKFTIDDLVTQVGISKGSFYAFHPSREDFIMVVFESWEEQYRFALLGKLLEGPGTIMERLKGLFRDSLALLEAEPALAMLGSRDLAMLMERLPPERIAAHQKRDQDVLQDFGIRLVQQGELSESAVLLLPQVLMALFSMALHTKDLLGPEPERLFDFVAGAFARELLEGVK